ncbi:MAG: hypothetical protein O2U62_04370, partial [Candidatus Bathyarchaeota archaeon]|nr:hypothetical protein [Candidatus Bathyarchaeota archaeon]
NQNKNSTKKSKGQNQITADFKTVTTLTSPKPSSKFLPRLDCHLGTDTLSRHVFLIYPRGVQNLQAHY